MKHHPYFEAAQVVAKRKVSKTRNMIADLTATIWALNCEIANEEDRARISDCSDAGYPVLARTLAARRDNLKITVAALARRLSEMGSRLLEP